MPKQKGKSPRARKTWGDVVPITRRIDSAKKYNRRRDKRVNCHDWD